MKKIALYGGSFDPIHIGHLITATNVIEKLNMDKVIFVPSNITPLKNNELNATNEERYKMIEESIKDNLYFEIDNYEQKLDRVSYTYYTAQYFKQKYPEADLHFIIGTDRVKDLKHWYNIEELSKIMKFIFVARDEEQIDDIIKEDKFYETIKYTILKTPVIEISSTLIREKIKTKKNVKYLLDENCANYIKEMKLYEI